MVGAGGANGPVVVVGDVIDDIIVRPLEPVTIDSDTVARIEQHPGGAAANVAVWLGYLGSPVRFFGRVGAADADVHRAAFAAVGVDAELVVDDDVPTGTIVVLLDGNGHRTMYTDRGANAAFRSADVPAGTVEAASILHVSGYALVEPDARAAARDLIGRARRAGVPVSLDPGSAAFIADLGAATFRGLIADADLVFPSLDEGRVLTGHSDPVDVVTTMAADHQVVALTLGDGGVLLAEDGGPAVAVAAPRVAAVDPTGAGDAFCAGFLHAFRAGRSAIDAAHDAILVAAEAVGVTGARPARRRTPSPVPTTGGDR